MKISITIMKKYSIWIQLLVILAALACNTNAQNEAKIWAFGDKAWIDFNTSPPTVGTSSINTSEGSSSVADAYGNPLFYTDGSQVWRNNHSQMPNGFGLKGNGSSTQSALIVPCNCGRYFIFTPGTSENQYVEGLNYTVVDMTSAGGLGNVINSPLKVNNLIGSKVSEKLAGISDGNGNYWVVAHKMNNNEFVAFKITTGKTCTISSTPVSSFVGATYTGGSNDFGAGQMKISPDGTKLGLTGLDYYGASFVELFNFNVSTGAVTNVGTTTLRDESTTATNLMFYGLEFSPNSRNLYVATGYKTNILFQYDATASTDTAFDASRDLVNSVSTTSEYWHYNQLQLAPDGKIYIARRFQTFLSAIGNPNDNTATATPASVGFVNNEITLAPGTKSLMGLPNVVTGNSTCFNTTPGGSFDHGFDTDGINTYPLPATQEIAGAALQQTSPFLDRIVVASRYELTNTKFEVRIFDKDNGSLIKTQSQAVGSNAFANAMTVDASNDNIYVGGAFGNDLDTCVIVRYSPNLLTPPQMVQISIAPAALKRCIITDLEVSGTKLYAVASTTDASFKQALSILRIDLPTFTPDATWKNPPNSNINGFVRTPLTPLGSAMVGAGKLAIDASRVYAFATISGSSNGTAVVAYDKSTLSPVTPTALYGTKSTSLTSGKGVYFIPNFSAEDMVYKAPNLILNADSSGNFGLAKVALPALSAGSLMIYPTVDLNQGDGAKMLALGSNYLISAGKSSTNTTEEIGIAKYYVGSFVLTNFWSPANLRSLALSGSPIDFTANAGDLRRIRTGNPSQRLMFNSVLLQSTGKIVVVGIKMITNTQWELVLMRIAN